MALASVGSLGINQAKEHLGGVFCRRARRQHKLAPGPRQWRHGFRSRGELLRHRATAAAAATQGSHHCSPRARRSVRAPLGGRTRTAARRIRGKIFVRGKRSFRREHTAGASARLCRAGQPHVDRSILPSSAATARTRHARCATSSGTSHAREDLDCVTQQRAHGAQGTLAKLCIGPNHIGPVQRRASAAIWQVGHAVERGQGQSGDPGQPTPAQSRTPMRAPTAQLGPITAFGRLAQAQQGHL